MILKDVPTRDRMGEILRRARTIEGITRNELGDRIGYGYMTIYMWEKGENISLENFWIAMEALGHSINMIVEEKAYIYA